MGPASERLYREISRQVARLQQALAVWPPGDGSSAAREELVRELEHRLGLLALLSGGSTARA